MVIQFNQFEIEFYEQRSDHGSIDFPESYPLLSPNDVNSTCEYYYDAGSFVNMSGKNLNLCSIDCPVSGCVMN